LLIQFDLFIPFISEAENSTGNGSHRLPVGAGVPPRQSVPSWIFFFAKNKQKNRCEETSPTSGVLGATSREIQSTADSFISLPGTSSSSLVNGPNVALIARREREETRAMRTEAR